MHAVPAPGTGDGCAAAAAGRGRKGAAGAAAVRSRIPQRGRAVLPWAAAAAAAAFAGDGADAAAAAAGAAGRPLPARRQRRPAARLRAPHADSPRIRLYSCSTPAAGARTHLVHLGSMTRTAYAKMPSLNICPDASGKHFLDLSMPIQVLIQDAKKVPKG